MPRIMLLDARDASTETAELLNTVQSHLGMVPNVVAAMANSRAALEAYLAFYGALTNGALNEKLREQIALSVAGANQCDYSASAHTTLAIMSGISEEETRLNLVGKASDKRTNAALKFVTLVTHQRGLIGHDALSHIRAAGYSDGELTEIIANVVIGIFANYFLNLADIDIDFPIVTTALNE